MLLPTSNVGMLVATEAMIVSTMKITSDARITGWRPMIWEKDAQDGWKTVEQSKKLVPHQKASMALPFSFVAIVYTDRKHEKEYALTESKTIPYW